MEVLSLSDGDWHLAWYPGLEWFIRNDHRNERLLGFIPARVPGMVQDELREAGLLGDLYRDMDSLAAEWVSQRQWLYKRFVDFGGQATGRRVRVRFEGVDCAATYFWNGERLGASEDPFRAMEFDVTPWLKDGVNVLAVALDEAPREQCQVGRTSLVRSRKPRFTYWWDFACRVIPLGLWQDANILIDEGLALGETPLVRATLSEDLRLGRVELQAELDAAPGALATTALECRARLSLRGVALAEARHVLPSGPAPKSVSFEFELAEPELWQPNGSLPRSLYTAELELYRGGERSQRLERRFGFKRLELTPNPGFSPEARYRFVVNGVPTFIKGWNWVPIDLLYGRPHTERYERLLRLARDAGVNLLRVWGGGLIEKEIFYRLCDEYGILVWQEFGLSSSGVDNEPPRDPEHLADMEAYAVPAIRSRRGHACLALWCGGNELSDSAGKPLDARHPLVELLDRLVEREDPGRPFLPTSASGPEGVLNRETVLRRGALHDVHGPWMYQGLREHYALYNANSCALHAEFGVSGAVPKQRLDRFISPDRQWPPSRENRVWSHHGAWFIDLEPLRAAFGPIATMAEYCRLSAYLQAEGLRYAVEANRRRWPECGGTLPWQFNEPFPNAVGTASVDYSGEPKMAYAAVREAYADLWPSLAYESQCFEGELRFDLWLAASTPPTEPIELRLRAYALSGALLFGRDYTVAGLEAEKARMLGSLRLATDERLVLVRLAVDAETRGKEYLFVQGADLSALREAPPATLSLAERGGYRELQATGPQAALFVRASDAEAEAWRCLLPGETRRAPCGSGAPPEWFNREVSAHE